MTVSGLNRDSVPRVSVSRDAHAWICCKDSFQPASRFGSPVCNDNLSRVLRVTHAHAAAVMERDPRRAAHRVDQRIQNRPVGDGVGAVFHRFGFTVG